MSRDLRTRVVIAASHRAVRSALQALAASDAAIDVVALAGDARGAARRVLQHHPEVLVLALPGALSDEAALVRELRRLAPDTAVVIATTGSTPTYAAVARAAGATAVVRLDGADDALLAAVRRAAALHS